MRTELLNSLPTNIKVIGDFETREVIVNNEYLNPDYSQQIRNHSPDGFNWGYGGSGPAQFALALLMLYLPVEEAQEYYQEFKFRWVARLPQSSFEVTLNLREEIEKLFNRRSKQ
jgi:hypothetical protein